MSRTSDQVDDENKNVSLPDTKAAKDLMSSFLLSLSYSSSIGGSGSIIVGTAPNSILKGFYDQKYPGSSISSLSCFTHCPVGSWWFLSVGCWCSSFGYQDSTSSESSLI